jgi:type VI secretion system secreted protein Hcp
VTTSARRWPTLASGAVAAIIAGAAIVALSMGGAQPPARAALNGPINQPCPPAAEPQAPIARTADVFLQVDDIKGDSNDAKFKGYSEVVALHAGVAAGPAGACDMNSVNAAADPIVLEKPVDRASPQLARLASNGKHFKKATVNFRAAAGGKPVQFLTYTLEDGRVLSVRQVYRGATLTEVLTLGFARLKYEYVPIKADGSGDAPVLFCYDYAANKDC